MKVADNVQISCINKRQHYNPHERIESVGGMHAGKPWKLTETEAIAGIKEGKWRPILGTRTSVRRRGAFSCADSSEEQRVVSAIDDLFRVAR
jgi:hypothetical protein